MLGHEVCGTQGFQASCLVAQPQQTPKKTEFLMAWEWIEHPTVSSKSNPSTPFGTILAVKTVQARDKPAHRSHQAPGMFEGPGAET